MEALHSGLRPQEELCQGSERPEACGSHLTRDEGYGEGH